MTQLLTELLKLIKDRPALTPFVVGGLLLSCTLTNVLNLPADLCNTLTDLGVFSIAIGLLIMPLKALTTRPVRELAQLNATVVAMKDSLLPEHGLSVPERLDIVEEDLEHVHTTQERLMDMASTPYYETTPKGRIVYVNKAYADLMKAHPERIYADQPLVHIHQRDQGRVLKESERAVEAKLAYKITARLVKDGRETYKVQFHGRPHYDGDRFRGHYGTVQIIKNLTDD